MSSEPNSKDAPLPTAAAYWSKRVQGAGAKAPPANGAPLAPAPVSGQAAYVNSMLGRAVSSQSRSAGESPRVKPETLPRDPDATLRAVQANAIRHKNADERLLIGAATGNEAEVLRALADGARVIDAHGRAQALELAMAHEGAFSAAVLPAMLQHHPSASVLAHSLYNGLTVRGALDQPGMAGVKAALAKVLGGALFRDPSMMTRRQSRGTGGDALPHGMLQSSSHMAMAAGLKSTGDTAS